MLSRNELKYYALLLTKKHRSEENKFLVEGQKLIDEAISAGYHCECLITSNIFLENNSIITEDYLSKGIRIEPVKQSDFDKLTDTKTPQGILGVFKISPHGKIQTNLNRIVALENISDPGNLGAIFRNCDWFGFTKIILSGDCAEVYNPKVIRSSAGSVFHLNIQEDENFYDTLDKLTNENFEIVCSDLNGMNLYEYIPPEKFVVVFCNEGNGPTKKLLNITGTKITIPKRGQAESLNVASASAVILSKLSV